MRLDISPRKFELIVESQDFDIDFRVPLCSLAFPDPVPTNLRPEYESGQLGKLSFAFSVNSDVYESDQPNNLLVNNALDVKEIEVPEQEFNPCILDIDGDGIITRDDLATIYEREGRIPLQYDINNDGVANDADFQLAKEYLGVFCGPGQDPPTPEYFGAFDDFNQDMMFGYSLNRLLVKEHDRKPLFRVVMMVNEVRTGLDYSFPDANLSRDQFIPMEYEPEVYYEDGNGTVVNAYNGNDGVKEAEYLIKDIFWFGSRDSIHIQLNNFYNEAKYLQEQNGFEIAEDFYNTYSTRKYLNTARVIMLFDQSGNNKHGYSGEKKEVGGIFLASKAPVIMANGNVCVGNDGNISISDTGVFRGFDGLGGEGGDNPSIQNEISFGRWNGSNSIDWTYGGPMTEVGQPAYMYFVRTYHTSSIIDDLPLGEEYESLDVLNGMAQYYGYPSFSAMFTEPDGSLTTDFDPDPPSTNGDGDTDSRDIFAGVNAYQSSLPGGRLGAGSRNLYRQRNLSGTNGNVQSVSVFNAYCFYWQNIFPVFENYYTGDGFQISPHGAATFYNRLATQSGSNLNKISGYYKLKEAGTMVVSLREEDYRLNNANNFTQSGPGLGYFAPSYIPRMDNREYFSEMAGFQVSDEEGYESVLEDVNTFFNATPYEDASIVS